MMINQHTRLYGVAGYPISQSLSPAIHNAAFTACGLNAVYLAFETKDIDGCLRGVRALGIKGMSITLPHKSAVIPLLDDVDGLAEKIGAVNTIVNEGGLLVGYNTDAIGALRALEEKTELSGKNCLIIGAGGAARAIGFILRERGIKLQIANRSNKKGQELAHALESPLIALGELENTTADILIHTTPVGMFPKEGDCIVAEGVLKKGMVVMDIVYNPLDTTLLKTARSRGCVTVDGLGMFIHQGAEQFRRWTGIEPPLDVMTLTAKEALQKKQSTGGLDERDQDKDRN
jgi:shikimate dehydrogenase